MSYFYDHKVDATYQSKHFGFTFESLVIPALIHERSLPLLRPKQDDIVELWGRICVVRHSYDDDNGFGGKCNLCLGSTWGYSTHVYYKDDKSLVLPEIKILRRGDRMFIMPRFEAGLSKS